MYKYLILLARLAGFEPAAYGLEVRSSIHLSYRRNVTFLLSRSRSANPLAQPSLLVTHH